jgi:RNA polymerase sigma factor (sigma-70 family)
VLRDGPRFVVSDREHLRALLSRLVENVLHVHVRRVQAQRRDVRREVAPPSGESVLFLDRCAATVETPSQAASADEARAWVRLALEMLDPEDRDVVLWREYQGLSFAEVAERLGLQEDAARMRFNRALPKLAHKLEQLRAGRVADALAPAP